MDVVLMWNPTCHEHNLFISGGVMNYTMHLFQNKALETDSG